MSCRMGRDTGKTAPGCDVIYVSSTCSRKRRISEAVAELAEGGFRNIELSGGTVYYKGFEEDLLRLRDRYALHYLAHNYFPPPESDFVVNLASADSLVRQRSLEHLAGAIDFCRRLEIGRFGFHAGFFVDPDVAMLGRTMTCDAIGDRDACKARFCEGVRELRSHAGRDVVLYVENNVCSRDNHDRFAGHPPFMGLRFRELREIADATGCRILFDVAHLYVTSVSMGLDFAEEMRRFMRSDYLHVSDNDGLRDLNRELDKEGTIFSQLRRYPLRGRTITLEISSSPAGLRRSLELLAVLD